MPKIKCLLKMGIYTCQILLHGLKPIFSRQELKKQGRLPKNKADTPPNIIIQK